MSDNPLQTKPLYGDPDSTVRIVGFSVAPTPDSLGLIITAPDGKVINLLSPQFGVSRDGKRLEVRVK